MGQQGPLRNTRDHARTSLTFLERLPEHKGPVWTTRDHSGPAGKLSGLPGSTLTHHGYFWITRWAAKDLSTPAGSTVHWTMETTPGTR